ncbi:MAG: YbhB/YbcL family Raf kinase inhibitor-like protein [Candidatus Omnitrophota bacterium]|nr:MAG: YbhB/YbcL family Raf kinase inhibitor-like protein [Candidatus Omnitrophota bacterium]
MRKIPLVILFSFLWMCATVAYGRAEMKLTSPDFVHNGYLPAQFSCEGQDVNPVLVIEGVPPRAQSLALIMDDPDAPGRTWVHWVVYNIEVTGRIEKNSVPGQQGLNDSGRKVYHGPCPPSGTHRYFFKVFALDTKLNLSGTVDKQVLERSMQGHILDSAELIGLYKRGARL